MNQVPTKIVLKSTTRMSLNDRFSNIMPNVQTMRANMAAEHQVSSANRRFAQQLANRPGILPNQAANMMMYNNNNNNMMMMRGRGWRGTPVQQRVGRGNVKARLSLPNNNRGRGTVGFRGGRGGNQNGTVSWTTTTNAVPFRPRGRGAIAIRSPRGRAAGSFRGGRGQQFNRNSNSVARYPAGDRAPQYRGGRWRPQNNQGSDSGRFTGQSIRGVARGGGGGGRGRGGPGFAANGGFTRGRGVFNRGGNGLNRGGNGLNRGGNGLNRGGNGLNRGGNGLNRGGRGFNRGGRGNRGGAFRGRGGGNNKPTASLQELDSQLDQYMSKSKSALDSELDAYMAQATD